jgi:hypothetical protein
MHRVILMHLTLSGLAVNASPIIAHQPDLGRFFTTTDLDCCRECCFYMIMPGYTLLTPQGTLLSTWHWEILPHPCYSPELPQFDFHLFSKMKHLWGYAPKLIDIPKRRSSDSNLCRMLYFTVMALTLWSATVMSDFTDVTSVLKKRLHIYLLLPHVLLTVLCMYFK